MLPDSAIGRVVDASDATHRLAAIDLGSNSFHLLVANYVDGQLHVVTKLGEKVQLAAGLDDQDRLDEAAMQRALECLSRFAPFIDGLPPAQLRVVGTNALRAATNGQTLIQRAEALLGHSIEIIAGREEARLIYLGAAHALAEESGRRLIIDIGGGSTEFIIGENFEPLALESLHMGCVTYSKRFFPDGTITEKRFRQAELTALSELASIRRHYLKLGWTDPVGSSGTIKAVSAVLEASGGPVGIIERERLMSLRKRLIACKRLERVAMAGLKEDRASVFPAGVAILCAIFEAFELEQMRYTDGALREGVLYDLAGRDSPEDSRLQTLRTLRRRYDVDERQAENVAQTARHLLTQVREEWDVDDAQAQFLDWAAQLHEIGLAISHSQFHRHGAYLLANSDLPGFSRPAQQTLAFLVRAHRRKFPLKELESLDDDSHALHSRLARLLRLAVILNRSRPERAFDGCRLVAKGDTLRLTLDDVQADRALLCNGLEQESDYQRAAGFTLDLVVP